MPHVFYKDSLIHFCHIPKTGGSSIEKWMSEVFGEAERLDHDWTRKWKRGGWLTDPDGHSPQHSPWPTVVKRLPKAPDIVFAVVRDPITRLESEYRFQSRHRRKRQAIARRGPSNWLRVMYAASRLYPSFLDNHFKKQAEFVPDHAEIFKFEDGLGNVARWLSLHGPEVANEKEMPGGMARAPAESLFKEPADLALISEWYAEDFERFGYPRPPKAAYSIGIGNWMLGVLVAAAFRIGRF